MGLLLCWQGMFSVEENSAFWSSADTYVSAAPHALKEAAELKAYADAHESTRGLIYFQTSGSEGTPKWVGLSRGAFLASAHAVNAHLEIKETDRWLISLPMYHVGGFSILARCYASGSSFDQWKESWHAETFRDACEERRITLTSLVPTQVYDLVSAGLEAPELLRAVVVGGGALSVEIGQKAQALGWPVLQSYGMTETASQIATEPLEDLLTGFDPARMEVLQGWHLQTAMDGRLTVSGKALASGYATLDKRVWKWTALGAELRTRDFVSLWPHGRRQYLKVDGRESEFVKVKGELVNLAAIQRRLNALTQAAAVCALPDERRGSKLLLVVESSFHSENEAQALWEKYHQVSLPHERLHERVMIDKLPRTALGKLEMKRLQEMLLSK